MPANKALEGWVQEKVASGRYTSASEVIREALRLLENYDQLQALRLEKLREEIAIGAAQLDRGEGVDGAAFVNELLGKHPL